jgi:MATE family multidrug resistance protein
MVISTAVAVAALLAIDSSAENALAGVWIVFGVWIAVRAGFGLLRIWPGIGRAPLGRRAAGSQ